MLSFRVDERVLAFDDIITIPNNKFLNEVAMSGNYGALDMQVVIPFYIGMDQYINTARDIIQEAASSSRYIHLPKPVVVLQLFSNPANL